MVSEIGLPMRIHEEVHFKTPSSKNNDEKSKTSLDMEGPTLEEIDRSVENTLPNSQMFSTDYSLSSQNQIARKGKKQVICFFNAETREERFKNYIISSINVFFFINP